MHNKLIPVLMLVGLTVLGACSPEVEASGDVSPGPAPGDAVEVSMLDNEFAPGGVEAVPGEQVTIEVTNRGDERHNFVVEDLDVSTGTLEPGDASVVTLAMPERETKFVCTFHGGMKGRLTPVTG